MPPPLRLALVAWALLAAGCNREYGNPFAQGNRTFPPPESTALVVPTGLWSSEADAPRELFALDMDGGNPTQLTFCNEGEGCDVIEPGPSPDRGRMMLRRLDTGAEGNSIVFVDLRRAAEAVIVPPVQRASGVDWFGGQDGVVVYSAVGEGDLEDLYRVDPDGQNPGNLTASPTVRERAPRIDPGGTVAVYQRIEAGAKGAIFIFQTRTTQFPVTSGGPGEGVLPSTGELVGTDTDPDFSPDARSIVFRRLASAAGGGPGTWDILTVQIDGSGLATIASGPAFRGAPDWGSQGILFTEIDAGTARLVLVQPDGSGRRVLLTQPATTRIGTPRWLPAAP